MVYRTLFLLVLFAILLITATGLAARFYLLARAKSSGLTSSGSLFVRNEMGPTNASTEINQDLKDQIDALSSKLANAQATLNAPKEIEKNRPALGLFPPVVVDRTQNNDLVSAANFKVAKPSKNVTHLTFELHAVHPGENTIKGYIVVLARNENALFAYPNVVNKSGPYMVDFERGETFQVARFRLVNAQFEADAKSFQVLIFTRSGELLINTTYEAQENGNQN